jgi:hypothetical protein
MTAHSTKKCIAMFMGPVINRNGISQKDGPNHVRLGWGHVGCPDDALSEACNAYRTISFPRGSFVGHCEALSRESYQSRGHAPTRGALPEKHTTAAP